MKTDRAPAPTPPPLEGESEGAERRIHRQYHDPLDLVWLRAAEQLGMRVTRSDAVYASWDGANTLTLASSSAFDADDSLAQLIFHEICHSIVAGPSGRGQQDWGLDNTSERDLVFEHACHRLQAALAGRYGLRSFFAVTTEWRPYWDALPGDPLAENAADPAPDPAIAIARRAWARAERAPFADVLELALATTAKLADLVREIAPATSLWTTARPRHVSGFLAHDDAALRCGDCAWARRAGAGFACRQSERTGVRTRLKSDEHACDKWEPRLDEHSCKSCGACCREGFDRVELRPRDVLRRKHPELVREDHFGVFVPRPDGRCLGLVGDGSSSTPYRCRVYDDRPRSCAEFAIGSSACLTARRRVGLSR